MKNFKEIHIGKLIKIRVEECGVEIPRICNFLNCRPGDLEIMYESESMDIDLILRWSKLLGYDFFRIYSQHLILYSPVDALHILPSSKKTKLPVFRKNLYTMEMIDSILEMIESGKKTKSEVINDYRIPKTTLYKWITKYSNQVPTIN